MTLTTTWNLTELRVRHQKGGCWYQQIETTQLTVSALSETVAQKPRNRRSISVIMPMVDGATNDKTTIDGFKAYTVLTGLGDQESPSPPFCLRWDPLQRLIVIDRTFHSSIILPFSPVVPTPTPARASRMVC